MSELKACPFCGGSAQDNIHTRDGRMVGCNSCYATIARFLPDANAKAREAWNTRTPTPLPDDVAAALWREAALAKLRRP